MRAFTVSIVVTLATFAAVSFAIPVVTGNSAPLAPRSHFCDNAPTVVAGTSFERRSLAPHDLTHRTNPVKVYCTPGSRTYITVALTAGGVTANLATFVLAKALRKITNQLAQRGDGLIPFGVFVQEDDLGRHELYLVNSNNHQQTWAVVGAALMALRNFILSLNDISGGFTGGLTFTVFDGTNEVGQGTIS